MAPRPAQPASRAPKGKIIHVALLRGINVGGKHMLPMADLAGMFTQAGCSGVRTYIQSGNVVFSASAAAAKRVPALISRAIADRFGFESVIVVRTGRDLERIAESHPFMGPGIDAAALHVGFLHAAPHTERVARLDPDRSPGDRFVVQGSEIYVHFGGGVAKSKLTNAYIDSALSTTSTFRNWRTVLKLAEMAAIT